MRISVELIRRCRPLTATLSRGRGEREGPARGVGGCRHAAKLKTAGLRVAADCRPVEQDRLKARLRRAELTAGRQPPPQPTEPLRRPLPHPAAARHRPRLFEQCGRPHGPRLGFLDPLKLCVVSHRRGLPEGGRNDSCARPGVNPKPGGGPPRVRRVTVRKFFVKFVLPLLATRRAKAGSGAWRPTAVALWPRPRAESGAPARVWRNGRRGRLKICCP
jgi:hypothetical protein